MASLVPLGPLSLHAYVHEGTQGLAERNPPLVVDTCLMAITSASFEPEQDPAPLHFVLFRLGTYLAGSGTSRGMKTNCHYL